MHVVNEPIQNKSKPSHVTFKLTTRPIILFSPQKMQWYHERMALLSNIKIFCQEYIKDILKIGHPEHSLTTHPLRPITSHFCLTPPPLSPIKVEVICVSPLTYFSAQEV